MPCKSYVGFPCRIWISLFARAGNNYIRTIHTRVRAICLIMAWSIIEPLVVVFVAVIAPLKSNILRINQHSSTLDCFSGFNWNSPSPTQSCGLLYFWILYLDSCGERAPFVLAFTILQTLFRSVKVWIHKWLLLSSMRETFCFKHSLAAGFIATGKCRYIRLSKSQQNKFRYG